MDLFTKICSIWLGLVAVLAVTGPFLPLPNPREADFAAPGVGPFSPGHILGTDSNGYDLLSNVVNGSRVSLMIALVSVLVGGLIGSTIGIISALPVSIETVTDWAAGLGDTGVEIVPASALMKGS